MGAGGKIRELRNEEILKSVIRAKAEAVKAVTACEGQINKADAFQEKEINTEEESKHLAEGDGVAPGTPHSWSVHAPHLHPTGLHAHLCLKGHCTWAAVG